MTQKYTTQEKELIKLFRKSKMEQLNFVVKHLFNGITEEEVIQYDKVKRVYKIGVHELVEPEMLALRAEAESIINTAVWQELYSALRLAANKMMYEDSKTIEDLYFPKAMLYCTEVIKTKLENLSKLK